MNHFNEIAEKYDRQISEHMREHYMERKVELMDGILKLDFIRLPVFGLDIGCGLGYHVDAMRKIGYQTQGIDKSRVMIYKARKKFGDYFHGKVYNICDIENYKNELKLSDFVYSINLIHHIKNQEKVINNIAKLIPIGGYYIMHEMNIINPIFRFYLNYIFPRMADIDTGNELWVTENRLRKMNIDFEIEDIIYFTFIPNFCPKFLLPIAKVIESLIERTWLRRYGVHQMIILRKVK